METGLRSLEKNIAIQGEMVGEGIQGNKLKIKGQTVFFFTLFWIDEYRYATYAEWKEVIEDKLGLMTVPVITDTYKLDNDINALLMMAERNSAINPEAYAEGLVMHVKESNELVSFKAINNEFLLKYGE